MKKRSRWMLLLSALLCLSILFASCQRSDDPTGDPLDSGTADSETDTGIIADPEEPIPANEQVDYKSLVDQWTKYLTYRAPEAETAWKAAELFTLPENVYETNYSIEYRVSHLYDPFIMLTSTKTDLVTMEEEYTAEVYHLTHGTHVGTWTATNAATADTLNFSSYDGLIFEVERITNGGVYTYDYYDALGNEIAKDVPVAEAGVASGSTSLGQDRLVVGGKVLIGRDGTLLATFQEGEERPVLDSVNELATYRGLTYGWGNDGWNDIFLVYDVEGRYKLRYTPYDVYDDYHVTILGDGNVLFEYELECEDIEEDYTYEEVRNGERYRYKAELLSVTDGTVREIKTDFYIDWMISNAEDRDSNLKLTDQYAGCQYAEIYKIVDRKLSEKPVFAILDGNLNIVAELPSIMKDQAWIQRAQDENTWILSMERVGHRAYYSLDLTTAQLSLYNENNMDRELTNGFILDQSIYNDKMVLLFELDDPKVLQWEEVFYDYIGSHVMATVTDAEGNVATKLLMIQSDGNLATATLGDENDQVSLEEVAQDVFLFSVAVYDDENAYVGHKLYNANGQLLVSGQGYQFEFSADTLYAIIPDGAETVYYVFSK